MARRSRAASPQGEVAALDANMIAAMPQYRSYAGWIEGGSDNPLGARALYLYRDGHDMFFRLHGTIEPETIGQAVSSGCIRLFNQAAWRIVPANSPSELNRDFPGPKSVAWQRSRD
jgi:lipoprotein-anchoring transpeptidase ErfK/SrfK